ncbi:MAG: GNAT family N-acetyltransferase [Elusimicrobiota bacterium]|nr:GNAT family N-acetyltransferase [Elusimicrobiota bacterium]
MTIRPAAASELEAVYRMGYDVWGERLGLDAYLAACRASPKYAAGAWWVSAGGDGVPLSSLLAHEILLPSGRPAVGLGSIATPPALRGRGHASSLIAGFLRAREESHGTEVFFLFSDIAPAFYERFGFAALGPCPGKPGSILMARANRKRLDGLLSDPRFAAPDYF